MFLRMTRSKYRGWVLLLPVCLSVGCQSVIVGKQLASPEYTATIVKRDSGAMSRGSTIVSVRLTSVPDNATHGTGVLDVFGDQTVDIRWRDPRHLFVSCKSCRPRDINFEAVKSGEVYISYDKNLTIVQN